MTPVRALALQPTVRPQSAHAPRSPPLSEQAGDYLPPPPSPPERQVAHSQVRVRSHRPRPRLCCRRHRQPVSPAGPDGRGPAPARILARGPTAFLPLAVRLLFPTAFLAVAQAMRLSERLLDLLASIRFPASRRSPHSPAAALCACGGEGAAARARATAPLKRCHVLTSPKQLARTPHAPRRFAP
jgi:hypothetical protein